jgi:hypothetical protein
LFHQANDPGGAINLYQRPVFPYASSVFHARDARQTIFARNKRAML